MSVYVFYHLYLHVLHSIQVAGTSGKALLEGGSDDEGSSTEAHGRAIIEVLGKDKRDEVLAALYMVRTDVSISVRQVGRTLAQCMILSRSFGY